MLPKDYQQILPNGFILLSSGSNILGLDLGGIIDEEGLQGKTFGEEEVADGVAPDGEMVECDGFLAFDGLLHCLQMRVHGHIHAYGLGEKVPVTVPTTIVPFFNSIVTVSLFSFIRKRTSFIY